jgi:hypothetical protein
MEKISLMAQMFYAPLSPPVLSWQIEGCAWLDAQNLLVGIRAGRFI